jgi:hypothetical protein
VAVAVAVGHQVIELAAFKVVPVPDEVDQSLPRPDRAIGSWYGVDEDVAVGINVIGDGIHESLGLCPQLPLGDEATPGHVAGIYRLGSGKETGAGAGPDSVGTNQEIDVNVPLVRKDDVHPPVSLLKANHFMAQQVSLPAKTSQQSSIDGVPGGEPIRLELLVDHVALAVQVADAPGRGADLIEVDTGALDQVAVAGGQEADAGAALLEFCR